jgi:hypothetical protein
MKRFKVFSIPAAILAGILLLAVVEKSEAQTVCFHYRVHSSGTGCGTPCVCDDCLECSS